MVLLLDQVLTIDIYLIDRPIDPYSEGLVRNQNLFLKMIIKIYLHKVHSQKININQVQNYQSQ